MHYLKFVLAFELELLAPVVNEKHLAEARENIADEAKVAAIGKAMAEELRDQIIAEDGSISCTKADTIAVKLVEV